MNLDIQLGIAGIGQGAVLAIFALGLVVIYSGSAVLNFGHGAIAAFAAYLFLWLVNEHHWNVALAFVIGLLVSTAIGTTFHVLVMRPLRNAPPLAKVVATLGLLVAVTAAIYLLFGLNAPPRVDMLPSGSIELPFGSPPFQLARDRLLLFVIAVAVTGALAILFRSTAFGLRTRALADSEVALAVTGHSPDRVAGMNWALGSLLAGAAGMLLSPLAPLTPEFYTTLMVTAIAAALLGGFKSFGVTFAAAMIIGIVQPVLTRHAGDLQRWTGMSGWTESLPLLVIIVVFIVRGRGLPVRDLAVTRPLPRVPLPGAVWAKGGIALAVSAAWVAVVPRVWVRGTTTSAVFIVLALSVVVVVGYLGQVSLAQMTFAGAGAFAAASASTAWNLPFPLPVLIGGLVAIPAGLVFGIPALRVRGMNLAVVTLALAIAAEHMVFSDPRVTGGDIGRAIEPPTLFGLDLEPFAHPRRWAFVAIVVAIAACLLVSALRARFLGMTFLATRENERGAAASGVAIVRTKLVGFGISSFIAGCGGAMLVYSSGQIGPASFATLTSVLLVAYAYLGGIGSISGAVVAGLIAPVGLVAEIIGIQNDWINLIAGLSIMQIVVLHPSGLAGIPHQIREHRRAKRPPDLPMAAGAHDREHNPVTQAVG